MPFLKIIEVIPPLFPISKDTEDPIALDSKMERFMEEVRSIRDFADIFLVANVKNQSMLKIDNVHVAITLQDFLRVEAAPVIVVRDHNRSGFLSTTLAAVEAGLKSLMIAWGDDYPASANLTNVRDYSTLADAIAEVSTVRSRARAPTKFFAPVNIESLSSARGIAMAKRRLEAGADVLLAQPPTTDAGKTFERHLSLIESAGLKEEVILNVFPFKNDDDARHYEEIFGWKLSNALHEEAKGNPATLLANEREVVRRSREEGLRGIYVSTRGEPVFAERILS